MSNQAETRLAEVEAAHRNQMRDVEATLAEVKVCLDYGIHGRRLLVLLRHHAVV